jgi:pimeloyl-ACP methyl ester carboxylesterase
MISRQVRTGLTGIVVVLSSVVMAHADERVWHGIAQVGERSLDVRLTVTRTGTETKALIDLVQARLLDFPLPSFEMDAARVRFEIPPGWGLAMFRDIGLQPEQQRITFEGTLEREEAITGKLVLAGAELPLRLSREFSRVPASATYRAEDVQFSNGEVSLSGTLLLPRHPKSDLPAVVFVAGSGSNSRKAHYLEAEAVAARGVAALVYDKRGAGRSTGANGSLATLEELASDVDAALTFLRARSEINARQIGLYGLSQGTWIGARVAARDRNIAFVIAVSGSGIPLWQQELYRVTAMMDLYRYSRSDIDSARDFVAQKLSVGRSGLGWEELQARMKLLEETKPKWYTEFAAPPSSLLSARYWWTAFFGYDPKRDLERFAVPVLNLVGGRDRIVPPKAVRDAMMAALPKHRSHVFHELLEADHSMLAPVRAGDHVVCQLLLPEYLTQLTQWVAERTRSLHAPDTCSR